MSTAMLSREVETLIANSEGYDIAEVSLTGQTNYALSIDGEVVLIVHLEEQGGHGDSCDCREFARLNRFVFRQGGADSGRIVRSCSHIASLREMVADRTS